MDILDPMSANFENFFGNFMNFLNFLVILKIGEVSPINRAILTLATKERHFPFYSLTPVKWRGLASPTQANCSSTHAAYNPARLLAFQRVTNYVLFSKRHCTIQPFMPRMPNLPPSHLIGPSSPLNVFEVGICPCL